MHLPCKKTYQDKKGYYKKQYCSSAKDCAHCPLRTSCIGGRANYKKIEETVDKPLYDQMHQRLQTSYAKRMKKLRQATVELVLGTLINFTGLRRIWTRGIKNANKFILEAAAAYNLKKWLNYDVRKTKQAAVVAMNKASLRLYFFILVLWHYIDGQNRKQAFEDLHFERTENRSHLVPLLLHTTFQLIKKVVGHQPPLFAAPCKRRHSLGNVMSLLLNAL